MRILIADDQLNRYDGLILSLVELGLSRDDIDLVPSANDARNQMISTSYDLFLLDILLPDYPEDKSFSYNHSIDLLLEVSEDDSLRKPGHIIGITADRTTLDEVSQTFNDRTWTIIEYSHDNDSWVTQVCNCVDYICHQKKQPNNSSANYHTDLVILCALHDPEFLQVMNIEWNWKEPRPISETIFVYDGQFNSNGNTYSVIASSLPRMGMVAAGVHTANILNILKPRLIVMTGICAGVKNKVDTGDIIFADHAWDYQSGKQEIVDGRSTLSIAPHQLPADSIVRSHAQQLSKDDNLFQDIFNSYNGPNRPNNVPNLRLGPVATGSAVIADGDGIKKAAEQQREVLGLEMEIYGFYAAVERASKPKPRAFALKSVCDFATPDKDDGFQQYASFTSAMGLKAMMEIYGDRILSETV